MSLQVLVLYVLVVLIWGSTWIAITYQLGDVAEEVSVAIRFGIASLSLFFYAAITGRQIRIPLRQCGMVILMGALMFSANYLFTYYAINYVTSGLVAVAFSLLAMTNGLLEKLFFGRHLEKRMVFAALAGVAGVTLMFWPEVQTVNLADEAFYGVILALVAVGFAAFGNMAAIVNTNRHIPIVTVNAHGMAWGTLMSLLAALANGRSLTVVVDTPYVLSMLYLSIIGTAIVFGFYIKLIRTIGSARAAYTSVLFPLVALLISTVFEDYQWSAPALAGILFVIVGNWLALTKQARNTQ